MQIVTALGHALWMAFTMLWQIFWGLSLGFLFSAVIEVVVSKSEMSKLLPDASPRSLTVASLLGAASSSCSYAAVAMARSIVRKGGDFTSAMAFQFAATNLVLELGVLMWVLISWQFAAAEFIGGPIMIVVLVLLFRFFLRQSLKKEAIEQADKGIAGSMEGHAAMSMGEQHGTWKERLSSRDGWIAISHSYVMNWAMLWRDIGIGLLIAGALGAWVPDSFWQKFFLVSHPTVAMIWGAFVGPFIAVASFTCSVGNVPLAAVLWNGGISFGGVASFHLWRPHHPSYSQHLPEILRRPDDGVPRCDLLSCDGLSGPRGRSTVPVTRMGPDATAYSSRGRSNYLQLHHRAGHRFRRRIRRSRHCLFQNRRSPHDAHDGGRRARTRRSWASRRS